MADNRSEDRHLSDFHIWLWNTKPWMRRLAYHPLNEGGVNPMQNLAKGVVSGAPDYCIDIPSEQYHGLRLEFKLPGKTQSANQKDCGEKLKRMGYAYHVVFSEEEARKITELYLQKSLAAAQLAQEFEPMTL